MGAEPSDWSRHQTEAAGETATSYTVVQGTERYTRRMRLRIAAVFPILWMLIILKQVSIKFYRTQNLLLCLSFLLLVKKTAIFLFLLKEKKC